MLAGGCCLPGTHTHTQQGKGRCVIGPATYNWAEHLLLPGGPDDDVVVDPTPPFSGAYTHRRREGGWGWMDGEQEKSIVWLDNGSGGVCVFGGG